MSDLVRTVCDAHIHLFEGGFAEPSGAQLAGSDEVGAYEALRMQHGVDCALVVGYEGDAVYRGNNAYLLALAREHAWIRPLVFVDAAAEADQIEQAMVEGACGASVYATNPGCSAHLPRLLREVANRLSERRAILSVNVVPALYPFISDLAEAFPELCVMVSHLGLPAAGAQSPGDAEAALRALGRLAEAPSVYVKASGFYALAGLVSPEDALTCVVESFGHGRVLWGSDFPPLLAHQTFAEALGVVQSAELSAAALAAIMGNNLAQLLAAVDR